MFATIIGNRQRSLIIRQDDPVRKFDPRVNNGQLARLDLDTSDSLMLRFGNVNRAIAPDRKIIRSHVGNDFLDFPCRRIDRDDSALGSLAAV